MLDRHPDVLRRQPSRDDQGLGILDPFSKTPVKELATARVRAVDEEQVGSDLGESSDQGARGWQRLDHERHALGHVAHLLRRLVAVELYAPETQLVGDLDDPQRRLVPEDADRERLGRQPTHDVASGTDRHLARRRSEDHPNGVDAQPDCDERVRLGGDAADLEERTVPWFPHGRTPTGCPESRATAPTRSSAVTTD